MPENAVMGKTSALIVLVLVLTSCGPQLPPPSATTAPTSIVIPTVLPNGRIEVVVRTMYTVGTSATIPLRVIATRGSITGPVAARILASGIGGGSQPSEVLVSTLAVTPVSASGGQTLSTTVAWDGRDATGALVPLDDYSLVMDFTVKDGSATTTATAAATLQWRAQ
jgi:hypothetical protein